MACSNSQKYSMCRACIVFVANSYLTVQFQRETKYVPRNGYGYKTYHKRRSGERLTARDRMEERRLFGKKPSTPNQRYTHLFPRVRRDVQLTQERFGHKRTVVYVTDHLMRREPANSHPERGPSSRRALSSTGSRL